MAMKPGLATRLTYVCTRRAGHAQSGGAGPGGVLLLGACGDGESGSADTNAASTTDSAGEPIVIRTSVVGAATLMASAAAMILAGSASAAQSMAARIQASLHRASMAESSPILSDATQADLEEAGVVLADAFLRTNQGSTPPARRAALGSGVPSGLGSAP